MKKFCNLLIALLMSIGTMAQSAQPCSTCLPNGITFTTQAEIDNFQTYYPGCTEILGHLTIDGNDINNLNGLNVLTSIGGTVLIPTNPALTSLSGLENLTSIGGNLTINGNTSLASLSGLEGLNTIAGSLTIAANNLLSNLTGTDSLTFIGGNLVISNMYSLTDLEGLGSLTSIGGHLSIFDNHSLTSLTGLENLASLGGYIKIGQQYGGNPVLTSLTGLDNINAGSITDLTIVYNDSLSTCDVQSICDYLAAPGGTFEIHDNATGCNSQGEVRVECDPELCMPDGISFYFQAQIDSFQINHPFCTRIVGDVLIGGRSLYGNDITNLSGLSTLTSIEGDLVIACNEFLPSLTGLNNLTSIGGSFNIGSIDYYCGNSSLTSLTGLENLTTIGGDLDIYYNDSLTNLTGLENLTDISGKLEILSNYSLKSLTGLNNLTSIGGDLYINFNDSLTSLTGLNNLTSIGNCLTIGSAQPYSGGGNPSLASLTGIENIDAGSITYLNISYNSSLSTCEVQSICDYLASPNGIVFIVENATGCNSPEEVEAACGVGVDESSVIGRQSSVNIYPNPANSLIYIEIHGNNSNSLISVFDFQGRIFMDRQVTLPHTEVDVSELNAGVYFVKVISDDGVKVDKFVKQ